MGQEKDTSDISDIYEKVRAEIRHSLRNLAGEEVTPEMVEEIKKRVMGVLDKEPTCPLLNSITAEFSEDKVKMTVSIPEDTILVKLKPL